MSSPAGGYGAGAGTGANAHHHHQHNQQLHGHTVLLSHAQHMAAAAAAASGGQLFHVPQHSRREKLRFPPDAAEDSPPTPSHLAPHHHHHQNNQAGAWPPPAFYSYASSSSSYSPHSPTAPQAQQQQQQLVLNGLTAQQLTAQAQQLPQIPTQNFSLTLSSASSNPATTPPTPRRQQQQLGGGPSPAAGPCGPFTGYATVLGRSKFLGPAQKLLAEICDVGGAAAHVYRSGPDEGLLDADPMDGADDAAAIHELDTADAAGPMSGAEQQWKKTRLISMMEEVCKRYRQYYQQVQAVITSFESVAGFSNAAPFTALALRVMAKHFRHIKGMILSQLRNTSKMPVKEGMSKDITIFGLGGGAPAGGFQRGSSANGFGQPQNIWRPQRGLPERSVTVLRAWLFEHFLHPYPTDGDKQMLAKQTGLTRNQVSNWFINARVRLWKPMVEEIHNLEMRQYSLAHSPHDKGQGQQQHGVHGQATQQHSSQQQRSGKRSEPCDSQPGQSSGVTRNHHSHSHPAAHGFPDELPQMSHSMQGQVSFAGYAGALPSQHQHNGMASPQHHHQVGGPGNGGGVSLTLGLHQNNRVCFGEPLPANLAHRFGLVEDVSDPYVMGSFGGGQDRHFAKEIGGHLLHDFVG